MVALQLAGQDQTGHDFAGFAGQGAGQWQ